MFFNFLERLVGKEIVLSDGCPMWISRGAATENQWRVAHVPPETDSLFCSHWWPTLADYRPRNYLSLMITIICIVAAMSHHTYSLSHAGEGSTRFEYFQPGFVQERVPSTTRWALLDGEIGCMKFANEMFWVVVAPAIDEKLKSCILVELKSAFDRAHRVLLGTPSLANPGWKYSNLVLSSPTCLSRSDLRFFWSPSPRITCIRQTCLTILYPLLLCGFSLPLHGAGNWWAYLCEMQEAKKHCEMWRMCETLLSCSYKWVFS